MIEKTPQVTNVNISIPVQQTLVKQQKIDFKQLLFLNQLRKWLGMAQQQKAQGLIYPKVKQKIVTLASKVDLPPELKAQIEEVLR